MRMLLRRIQYAFRRHGFYATILPCGSRCRKLIVRDDEGRELVIISKKLKGGYSYYIRKGVEERRLSERQLVRLLSLMYDIEDFDKLFEELR